MAVGGWEEKTGWIAGRLRGMKNGGQPCLCYPRSGRNRRDPEYFVVGAINESPESSKGSVG